MARNVNDIISALPAARRRKIEKRARLLISEEMSLQELRRAREMTEVKMASFLGVAQKQISNIEKRTDMHISTLRRSIEEMGGKLSLVAEFPDRNPVVLSGITALDIQACRRLAPAGPVVYLWTGSTQYGTPPEPAFRRAGQAAPFLRCSNTASGIILKFIRSRDPHRRRVSRPR